MAQEATGLLFLCVANSARSQMAEGIALALAPPGTPVFSAGSEPALRVHPNAVEVMREIGVDITNQHPKSIDRIPLHQVGTVITLCAEEVCPTLPGVRRRLHWPLRDPAVAHGNTPADALGAFRDVRDEIRARLDAFFAPRRDRGR
jgi:arsenate reductase